ncbi:MAG: hypothetical protein Fur0037_22320 [Planctomycetota bacterium]
MATIDQTRSEMRSAVFVDFENLYHSLKGRPDLGQVRIRDLSLSILENLKGKLLREGCPMVLGRSYAAFDAFPGMEVAHDLALMGLDPQYVLVGSSGKNSADIHLAVDVSRVLFRRADIDLIVIVSGDRDFIPVARQVLEENRDLRVVAIPDTTSGDLRMRVGSERYWNALDFAGGEFVPAPSRQQEAEGPPPPGSNGSKVAAGLDARTEEPPADRGASVVGRIPVTWSRTEAIPKDVVERRLVECLELLLRSQARHGSREIWLSPFLKGPMSQHFGSLVHPERRALINELRMRGAIRIEERENLYADYPYSVIVLDENHEMVRAAKERMQKAS